MSGINSSLVFGRRKEAAAKDRRISALFIILLMSTAATVREKVRTNQFNILLQPASNCILTGCKALQTTGLDACRQQCCYRGSFLEVLPVCVCVCAEVMVPRPCCSSHAFSDSSLGRKKKPNSFWFCICDAARRTCPRVMTTDTWVCSCLLSAGADMLWSCRGGAVWRSITFHRQHLEQQVVGLWYVDEKLGCCGACCRVGLPHV